MTDSRWWQPAANQAPHPVPSDTALLAAPRKHAVPCVHGHAVISDVPTHHRLHPLAQFGDGFVHPSLKLGFHLIQLRLQPLWRLIRNAFAVGVRLGDPRVVPCFCCMFPLAMPSSTTAGTPLAVGAQFLRQRHWPSPELERLGTPKKPHHLLPMGRTFAASLLRYSLRPAQLLATLADRTGYFSQPTAAFPSRLSTGRSPFPPLDVTTVATEQVPPAGLSPAGTSASIAAPTPSTYETFIHNTLPV